MRIRRDSPFISCVLFTIALLCLVPSSLNVVLTDHDRVRLQTLDAGFRAEAETMSNLGIASLAIILIGLIVVWTGYIERARSAWLVMFVVVWVWASPLLVVPLFHNSTAPTFSELFYGAIYQSGLSRVWAKSVLIFLLMLIALLMPIRPFFLAREVKEPSRRFIGYSLMGVLIVLIALVAWIHLRVYEIPINELNFTHQLPPPPPPTPDCKAQ